MSRRLGEEGQVILLLTVDQRGRVVAAKVEKTSGFERLDKAALVGSNAPLAANTRHD